MRKLLLASTTVTAFALSAQAQSPITDAQGNAWTIANGLVLENGAPAGYSARVIELAYVNGTIWQENADTMWWQWTGMGWGPDLGTPTSPVNATQTVAARPPCGAAPATLSSAGGFGILPLAAGGVGKIFGADQQPFVPRGIGVLEGQEAPVAQLQADFPGINFVRYAIYDYPPPGAISAYVTSLTSAGIIVEIEDHNNSAGNAGGGQGVIFTGAALTNELDWYSAVATALAKNPLVWWGTNNEPSQTDAAGANDPSALSNWQWQTYQAIRNAGNNAPILLEANCGSSNGQPTCDVGYNSAAYSQMVNVAWDMHDYGWVVGYSTDPATNSAWISAAVGQLQKYASAGGVGIPVIIGEYGNSTTGLTIDPNGTQVVAAVQQAVQSTLVAGSAAWAWGYGNPGDGLLSNGGGLSDFGQQVAAYIATPMAGSGVTTVAPPPTSATCAANGTTQVAQTDPSSTQVLTATLLDPASAQQSTTVVSTPVASPTVPVDPAITQVQGEIDQADATAAAQNAQIQGIIGPVQAQIQTLKALIQSGQSPPATALTVGGSAQ
jgi:hypothetical protein